MLNFAPNYLMTVLFFESQILKLFIIFWFLIDFDQLPVKLMVSFSDLKRY